MSICENCKALDICTEANKDKEACWFFSPTEKYRIEQSKEYVVGYNKGRADVIDELKAMVSRLPFNKQIQTISMDLLWEFLEQLKEKKE